MPVGRPPTYPFRLMAVGDSITLPAPTPADAKRIRDNASQYGIRTGRYYHCRTADGQTTVTRAE
jgi:hypothetical protein